MSTIHRNEKYEGKEVTKPEIISLFNQLNNAEKEVKRLTEEILKLQKICNHDYYFSCAGMHDDSYICIHCQNFERF
jgi:hypothetical protein